MPKCEALRGVLETGLSHRGVLVAFGADKCSSLGQCGDAGIRRYLPISIMASADCFNDSRGRPRYPPLRLSLLPCCRLPCGAPISA